LVRCEGSISLTIRLMKHPMNRTKRKIVAYSMLLACVPTPALAASFEEALSAAYTNHPAIHAERARQAATDETVAQAASGFRPTVGATYQLGSQRTEINDSTKNSNSTQLQSLRLEQPLYRGGGTLAALASAKEQVRSGQFDLAATEQRVLREAAVVYFDVMAAIAQLDLAEQNASVLASQLAATRTRFAVGEVTRTDMAQAQARLEEANAARLEAQARLLQAQARYAQVVGEAPMGDMRVGEQLPTVPASLEEALEKARALNPEVLAAIHRAEASTHDVRFTKAAMLPRASLVGSLSRQRGAGIDGRTEIDQDRIGVEVTIPLYQSGAEYSRVRQAAAIARQRDYEQRDEARRIEALVQATWQEYTRATAAVGVHDAQIAAAQEALDGVKREQVYGTRTVLDVLDAERELFGARTAIIRAQRDHLTAVFDLALTMGELTPAALQLPVATYQAEVNSDRVDWKAFGF
jgi:outer membrane protein